MTNDEGGDERVGRAIRLDLVIAMCALLVSTLATAASWWQTRVIAQQLSAQVWPYVSFSGSAANDRIELDIVNDGLGPAVVKSFVLKVDGKPQHDLLAALQALGVRAPHDRRAKSEFLFSNVKPGEVIRPSRSLPIFRASGSSGVAFAIARQSSRLGMELCYCSILATCWNIASPFTSEPAPVAVCADRRADQTQDITQDQESRSGF